MSMRTRVVAILVATLALLLTSCDAGEEQLADVPDEGQTATETETVDENVATQRPQEPGQFTGRLNVLNQLGDGQSVVVSRASMEEGTRALAVVYDDADDAPGRPLGFVEVPAAAEGSQTVELDEPLESGSHQLWVVMHVDADPIGQFDPGTDPAVATDGDDTLRDSFTYTVTDA